MLHATVKESTERDRISVFGRNNVQQSNEAVILYLAKAEEEEILISLIFEKEGKGLNPSMQDKIAIKNDICITI